MEFIGAIFSSANNLASRFSGIRGVFSVQEHIYKFHSFEEFCRNGVPTEGSFLERIRLYVFRYHYFGNHKKTNTVIDSGYVFFVYSRDGKVYVSVEEILICRMRGAIRSPSQIILSEFPILTFQDKKFALISDNLNCFMSDNCDITVDL